MSLLSLKVGTLETSLNIKVEAVHVKLTYALALLLAIAACDDGRSPTAPEGRPATIVAEPVRTTAVHTGLNGFVYRFSLALRERAGLGATISRAAATLTDTSGTRVVTELSTIDGLDTSRIDANATLVPTITVRGPLITASEVAVNVSFIDDNGHSSSAQTTTGVRLDLTGDWTGRLPINTLPTADWSSAARIGLVQKDGGIFTGELVSADGRRFPLDGVTRPDSFPSLTVRGLMPTGSLIICGVVLSFVEFEFVNGQVEQLSGRATGRCPGTLGGNFVLQR